jgi:hypothetical protein
MEGLKGKYHVGKPCADIIIIIIIIIIVIIIIIIIIIINRAYSVDRIHLARDVFYKLAVVNTVMSLVLP